MRHLGNTVGIAVGLAMIMALTVAPNAGAAPPESSPADCIVLMQPLQVHGIPGSPRSGLPLAPVATLLPIDAQCY